MVFYICWMVDGFFDAVAVYMVQADNALHASALAMDLAEANGLDYEFGEWPEPATEADIRADLGAYAQTAEGQLFEAQYDAWYEAGMPRPGEAVNLRDLDAQGSL